MVPLLIDEFSLNLTELLSHLYCVWSLGRRHFYSSRNRLRGTLFLFLICVIYLLIISSSIHLLFVIVKSMSWLIASAAQHLFHTALVICLRTDVLLSPVLILYFFVHEL